MRNEHIKVYLIAGQSNALGIAQNIPGHPELLKDVFIYQEGGAEESNGGCCKKILPVSAGMGYTEKHFGLEVGMAEIFSKRKAPLAIIKCAWAGTGLYDFWNPGNNGRPMGYGYANFLRAVENGMETYRATGFIPSIEGIAWMQGESDADKTEKIANEYLGNLINFFDSVKSVLKLSDVRLAIGEIYPYSELLPLKDIVIAAQKKFVANYPNAVFIETGDIPVDLSDAYHWYGNEEVLLGRRFAEALVFD